MLQNYKFNVGTQLLKVPSLIHQRNLGVLEKNRNFEEIWWTWQHIEYVKILGIARFHGLFYWFISSSKLYSEDETLTLKKSFGFEERWSPNLWIFYILYVAMSIKFLQIFFISSKVTKFWGGSCLFWLYGHFAKDYYISTNFSFFCLFRQMQYHDKRLLTNHIIYLIQND